MKVDPETERKCLALAGFPAPTRGRRKRATGNALVEPAFTAIPLAWTIPIETASEANGRDWRARSRRADAAWKAVSKAVGPKLLHLGAVASCLHGGRDAVRVRLVRLGGKRLDRSNLPPALKAVEDALAFILGIDDGDPRWRCEWEQEVGGPAGVRAEVAVINDGMRPDLIVALGGTA